jgi:hypothetical protein
MFERDTTILTRFHKGKRNSYSLARMEITTGTWCRLLSLTTTGRECTASHRHSLQLVRSESRQHENGVERIEADTKER